MPMRGFIPTVGFGRTVGAGRRGGAETKEKWRCPRQRQADPLEYYMGWLFLVWAFKISRARPKGSDFFFNQPFFSVFNHGFSFVKPKLFSTFQVGSTILRTDIQIASSYSNDEGNRTGVQCRYTWHEMELTNKPQPQDSNTERSGAGPRSFPGSASATVVRGRRTSLPPCPCASRSTGRTFKPSPAPWSLATAAKRGASRLQAPPPAAAATSRRRTAADEAPEPWPSDLVRSRGTGGGLHDHRRCNIGQEARPPGSPSTRRSLPLPLPPLAAPRQISPTVRPRSRTPSGTRAPGPRPRSRRPWPLPPAGATRGRRRRGRERDAPWQPPP